MQKCKILFFIYVLCADIDECAKNTDTCSEQATCQNTAGGFSCSCNTGYHGDGTECYGKFLHLL